MSHLHSNSSFTSCFFPTTHSDNHPPDAPPPSPRPASISGKPNLTTCVYSTNHGLFSVTWSRSTFLGRSLHLDLHQMFHNCNNNYNDSTASPVSYCSNSSSSSPFPAHSAAAFSFHLHIKPFMFWRKLGSKKLTTSNTSSKNIQIFWDLSNAKFGSAPEPKSGFYIAVVVDGEMTLLIGDSIEGAYAKKKLAERSCPQALVLRREHVFRSKVYTTKAKFGGKTRDISIDCSTRNGAKLCFSVDNVRVLQVKRLKWKFRGNERIEVDGVPVQISWDVYNWLFDHPDLNSNVSSRNGHAVFMFRFDERDQTVEEEEDKGHQATWQQLKQSGGTSSASFGMSGIERRKMRKSLMMRAPRSSSSSSLSMSSSSSGCSSSVMEWANMEENDDLSPGPNAFSLVVYVWKK